MYGHPGMQYVEGRLVIEGEKVMVGVVVIAHTAEEVKDLEELGYHVVSDSDLMSGGEV